MAKAKKGLYLVRFEDGTEIAVKAVDAHKAFKAIEKSDKKPVGATYSELYPIAYVKS